MNLRSREHSSRSSLDLKIVYRRIDELRPDPTNPRQHTKKQIRQIAASIKAFDFNVPILIDRDDNVIAGHGRLDAGRELGWAEVPTLCLDHLSPEQARAFRIADNRLTEISAWDDRLLAQQLKDLSLLGLDFNIEVTGFEMAEIDLRIAGLEEVPEQADDPADAVPEVSAGPSVSKLGDLWLLGGHRVFSGNALDPKAFAALMGDERAAMVFTDRPTMCRSTVIQAASARSIIAPSRWLRPRWTQPNSLLSSARLSATSAHSVLMAHCTTSAWTGAMSKTY
jgi:ParB-like nuclease domain